LLTARTDFVVIIVRPSAWDVALVYAMHSVRPSVITALELSDGRPLLF